MAKATEAGAYLGERQNALSAYINQFHSLQGTLRQGVGNLVDADLAKEAARLESANARQGLSNRVLSIANAAPQWLQRLFRPS